MAEINDNDMKHALKQAERKGRRKGWFARIRTFFVGIIAGMLILTCFTAYMHGLAVKDAFKALFTTETAVENRDLTLINHRIFGYKAADFAEAVLGDEEQLKKAVDATGYTCLGFESAPYEKKSWLPWRK